MPKVNGISEVISPCAKNGERSPDPFEGRENQIQDTELSHVFKDSKIIENAQYVGANQGVTDQQTEHARQFEAFRNQRPKYYDETQ